MENYVLGGSINSTASNVAVPKPDVLTSKRFAGVHPPGKNSIAKVRLSSRNGAAGWEKRLALGNKHF